MRLATENRYVGLLVVLWFICPGVSHAASSAGHAVGWNEGDLPAPFRTRFGPHLTLMLENNSYAQLHGDPLTEEHVRRARADLARLDESGLGESREAAEIVEYYLVIFQRGGRPADPEMRELAERLVRLREKLGPNETAVAIAYTALGIAREVSGDLMGAESAYSRAHDIELPAIPRSRIHRLRAAVLARSGDFVRARLMLESLIERVESTRGPRSPKRSDGLGWMGALLVALGDHETAKPLLERALARPRQTAVRAVSHGNNLAIVFAAAGDDVEAERGFRRALQAEDAVYGPMRYQTAITRYNLALLRAAVGDLAGGLRLLQLVVQVQEDYLGLRHPDLAMSLLARANILVRLGDYETAGPLFERSIAIQREIGESTSPHLPFSLASFARFLQATGAETRALELSLEAERLARRQFKRNAAALSHREALLFETLYGAGLDVALTYLTSRDEEVDPTIAGRVWEQLARSRSIVLDEMVSRQRIVTASRDTESLELRAALARLRHRLARVALEAVAEKNAGPYLERLRQARSEKERLERALARGGFGGGEETGDAIGLDAVAEVLKDGTALVSYARYDHLERETPSYAALVLPPGTRFVRVLDLGAARAVDPLVAKWRRSIEDDPRRSPEGSESAEQDYRAVADPLRRALWDPVVEVFGDAEQVLIVPDGPIHLVNFAALPSSEDRYLIDSGPLLHYLSTERDVLEKSRERRAADGLLALGGPDFDAASRRATRVRGAETTYDLVYRSSLRGCRHDGIEAFPRLPGAEKEVRTLEKLWNRQRAEGDGSAGDALALTGRGATEAAFKQLSPRYRVAHLATHGFLLARACDGARADESLAVPVEDAPLLLSGLALAGANKTPDARTRDLEDGMLTAEEIASLDLTRVEWVVLSGCETGLGELRPGEGVLGLRRSFEIAGAGSLITSLWPVDDDAARLWMEKLYRARLDGRSTAESVREASLGMLREARAHHNSTHPFSWGAFVGVGDWR